MRRAPRFFFHSYFFSCKRADDEWEGAIGGDGRRGGAGIPGTFQHMVISRFLYRKKIEMESWVLLSLVRKR